MMGIDVEQLLALAKEGAGDLLEPFYEPGVGYADRARMVGALRPRAADFDLAFSPAATQRLRPAYDLLWAGEPVFGPMAPQTRLFVSASLSDDIAGGGPRARGLPAGYRAIAHHLRPGRIWVSWAFVDDDDEGTLYDGLLFLGDRFAWFPQPFRFLADPGCARRSSPLAHFVE
jgi:hypothetical protein